MSVICNRGNGGVYGNPNLPTFFIRASFGLSNRKKKTDIEKKKNSFAFTLRATGREVITEMMNYVFFFMLLFLIFLTIVACIGVIMDN